MRSILDSWEITQDRPSPYEPIKLQQKNLTPFKTGEEYIKYINKCKPQAIHRYDETYNMPGRYTHAEIVNDVVWIIFTPEKLGGKYWVSLAK